MASDTFQSAVVRGIKTMRTKQVDVLSRIPSPSVIRERLSEVQVEARKLQILLEVAERIEAEKSKTSEVAHV